MRKTVDVALLIVACAFFVLGFWVAVTKPVWTRGEWRWEGKPVEMDGKKYFIESRMIPYWGGDWRKLQVTLTNGSGF